MNIVVCVFIVRCMPVAKLDRLTNARSNYVPGWTTPPSRPSSAGSFSHLYSVFVVERPPLTTANMAALPVTWSVVTLPTPYFRLSTSGRRHLWRHLPRPTCGAAVKMADGLKRYLTPCTRNTTPTNMASPPEMTSELQRRPMTSVRAVRVKMRRKQPLPVTAPPVGVKQQRQSSVIHQMALLVVHHRTTWEVTINCVVWL